VILLVCTFFQSSKLKLIVVISTQIDDITSHQWDMSATKKRRNIQYNDNGGVYAAGVAFTEEKWVEIQSTYLQIMDSEGSCSERRLATECRISRCSANKAITSYNGGIVPVESERGHGRHGIGSMYGLKMKHHQYIYQLYQKKPSRPRLGYIRKFQKKFNIVLNETFITRWFHTIGPFKGTMRLTSVFPPNKDSPRVAKLLNDYCEFIAEVEDHKRLVFADEKPFEGKDIFDAVRRDPLTGEVPQLRSKKANVRERYNCMTAVALKKRIPAYSLVFDANGDSFLFFEFVMKLLEEGILAPWDIFIVDNCTIHFQSQCEDLQNHLWNECQILMIPLPPYHAELNPTELAFQTLFQRLRALRCEDELTGDFKNDIQRTLDDISYQDVKGFFRNCGYYK
jgi:hypothetical protein